MGRRIYLLAPREECEDGAYCLRIFLAARSSPLQKVNHVRELKDSVAHERKEKDKWRERALEAQQELEPKELDNDRYAPSSFLHPRVKILENRLIEEVI